LSGATTYGLPTSALYLPAAGGFSANYATTLSNNTMPQNTYIFAMATRSYSSPTNSTPLISYTNNGNYTQYNNAVAHTTIYGTTSASNSYFVMKAPTNPLSATGYLTFAFDQTMNQMASSNIVATYYSSTYTGTIASGTAVYKPTWTAYNGNPTIFQAVGTINRTW